MFDILFFVHEFLPVRHRSVNIIKVYRLNMNPGDRDPEKFGRAAAADLPERQYETVFC